MSPLALELLRRIALWALVITAILAALPRFLMEAGLFGPTAEDEIVTASQAVAVAESYGATPADGDMKAATGALEDARRLAVAGEGRRARREARRAEAAAVAAQQVALARQVQARFQAQTVLREVDRLLNELEDLYDEITPGLPAESIRVLFSTMKHARQKGAALFLAFEEGRYPEVMEREAEARASLAEARKALEGARR